MTEHKATEKEWTNMEDGASDGFDDGYASCLIELRARVEALEIGLKDEADCNIACLFNVVDRVKALESEVAMEAYRAASAEASGIELKSKPTPNDRQIRSSLVKRVVIATATGTAYESARAAIREVAEWLRSANVGYSVDQSLFNLGECTYEDMGFEAVSTIAEILEVEARR